MATLNVYIVTFLDDTTVEVSAPNIKQFIKDNGPRIKHIDLKKAEEVNNEEL